MVLSGATLTSYLAIAREVAADLHVFEIVFFRSIIGMLLLLPWLARRGLGVMRTERMALYLWRSGLTFFGLTSTFYALTLLPFAELSAISFSRPFFASILAILIFGEIARLRRWTAIVVGFMGALVVIRPGVVELNPGVAFALLGVVTATIGPLMVKALSRTEEPDTIVMYHMVLLSPIALVASLFFWKTPNLEQLMWLGAIGFLGLISQQALTRAYAAADATICVSIDFTRLPLAALIGFVFFAEIPSIYVWTGGAVIFMASFFLMSREAKAEGGAGAKVS